MLFDEIDTGCHFACSKVAVCTAFLIECHTHMLSVSAQCVQEQADAGTQAAQPSAPFHMSMHLTLGR